jgi:hypothetical protein
MFGVIEGQKQTVAKAVEAIDEESLREEPLDALADELAQKHTIDVPVIAEDGITVSPPREVEVTPNRNQMFAFDDYSGRTMKGISVTFRVPYTGDKILFSVRPTTFTLNPPRATIDGNVVEVSFSGINLDSARIKAEFENTLRSIKDYLANQARDVSTFNAGLKQLAYNYLQARKSRLKQNDDLVSGLGYRVQ